MARRVLELIVTGKDQASPEIAKAESALESLGSTAAGAGQNVMTFAEHVEEGRRMMAGLSSESGSAANSLGGFASGAGGAGMAASSAGADMSMLTGTISMLGYGSGVSRRGVMMFTRGIRLLGMTARSSIRDLSRSSRIMLGVGAAGLVGAVGIGAVVSGLMSLAKRSVEADDKRVDFEEWTADAGGHVEVLGRLRDATGGLIDDLTLQEDATKAVTDRVKELMRADKELIVAGRLLTEAEARRLALMEYDRGLIQDAVTRGDRLGDTYSELGSNVDNLADSVGQRLTPALDTLSDPIDRLVTQTGPGFNTWASGISDWFENRIPGAVGMSIDKIGLLLNTLAAMMNISARPLEWKVEMARGLLGPSPAYQPAPMTMAPYTGPRVGGYQEGAATRDVHVSGSIDVHISGDRTEAGRQIGRGIQAELQRIGIE